MKCSREKCPRPVRARGLCPKHYESAIAAGEYVAGFVSPDKAREHVTWLDAQGMYRSDMARVSGLRVHIFRRIFQRPVIYRSTEQKILAIQPLRLPLAAHALVPVLGSQRRLRALVALGYTSRDLAARKGLYAPHFSRILHRDKLVEADTARTIEDLYGELHMVPGPSEKSRRRAHKLGWVPPLAWDDIDDPNEQPDLGVEASVTWLEKYTELKELGVPESRIPERMGVDRKSVERQLMRLGITKGAA